jgi:hypothetical protein
MDNGLLFPYRCYEGKGGTRKGRLSIPIGHGVSSVIGDAGAGKSTPDIVAEDGGKLRQKQSDSTQPMPPRKSSLPLI